MSKSGNSTMSSSKSYLVDALYRWIVDNNCTPYVLVNAYMPGVEVPQEHVKDGQIVLNIAPTAIADLSIDKKGLSFSARFSGIPMAIYAPTVAILGIYARENGQGMMFDPEPDGPNPDNSGPDKPKGPKLVSNNGGDGSGKDKPSLRVVK